MKKLLFLLAFVVNATLAFAMTGPAKMGEPQKLLFAEAMTLPTPCLICADCKGLTVCGYAGNCASAGLVLAAMLEQWGCNEDD